MGLKYDHPNFLIIRERQLTGAISAAGVASAYIGSSLKVFTKPVVTGVSFRVGSGGSAAGTNSMKVSRVGTGGTQSTWQTYTMACSAGASAAGEVHDVSLASGMTIHSLGEAAALSGVAASLDKVAVLSDVVWRYRILPYDMPGGNIG